MRPKILTRFKGKRNNKIERRMKFSDTIQSTWKSPAMHESTGSTIAKSQIEKCKKGDYFTRFRIFRARHQIRNSAKQYKWRQSQPKLLSISLFFLFIPFFCSLSFTNECVEPFELSGIISLCYASTIACFHRH